MPKHAPYRDDLSAEEVRRLFDYYPETGVLIWEHRDNVAPQWNTRYAGQVAGSLNSLGYRSIRINGRPYFAHRLAYLMMTGAWPTDGMDHKNGHRADNRWCNLRPATPAQNARNRKETQRGSATGVRGVRPHGNKFIAHIRVDGKRKHLGTFPTIVEASVMYQKAAREAFGEFCPGADSD